MLLNCETKRKETKNVEKNIRSAKRGKQNRMLRVGQNILVFLGIQKVGQTMFCYIKGKRN